MVDKSENKLKAENRRRVLRSNLKLITEGDIITSDQIKTKYGFDFPTSLAVAFKDDEINIAICAQNKFEANTGYELDTWAFALYSVSSKNISDINFYVQIYHEYSELLKDKWYDLFVKRLSFLNKHKSIQLNLRLFTFDNHSSNLKQRNIPLWSDIEDEIDTNDIHSPDKLGIRNNKSKHDEEDKEQNRIIFELTNKDSKSFVYKEFPIVYQKHKEINKYQKNRIDIVHTDNHYINIIEVKVKKELDVVAQILDYNIFVKTRLCYFDIKGWDTIKMDKILRCYILCNIKHPMLDKVSVVYRNLGFNNFVIFENENGHYGNLL